MWGAGMSPPGWGAKVGVWPGAAALEPVRWTDAVDHAKRVGVHRLQGLAGEEHLVRDTGAGEPRQKPAHPTIRCEPDVDEGLEDVGLGRGDPDVARERVARSDADRRAVHRRDHR